jgi:hypothetical protein
MDVINGATERATVKFKKISKLGNKLWISKASKEMIYCKYGRVKGWYE